MTWYTCLDTPIGSIRMTSDGTSLTGIYLEGDRPGRATLADIQRRDDAPPFVRAKEQLSAYFRGELTQFDLPLAPEGTTFQRKVWEELRRIPYGRTVSYGEVARRLGRPNACRAVGLANRRNPIPIVVPCHRVIGADGSLTGYGGGLACKRTLLDLEARAKK
jgi:methylated-DNA-[protein]-cysteine S-methyltransferase